MSGGRPSPGNLGPEQRQAQSQVPVLGGANRTFTCKDKGWEGSLWPPPLLKLLLPEIPAQGDEAQERLTLGATSSHFNLTAGDQGIEHV